MAVFDVWGVVSPVLPCTVLDDASDLSVVVSAVVREGSGGITPVSVEISCDSKISLLFDLQNRDTSASDPEKMYCISLFLLEHAHL